MLKGTVFIGINPADQPLTNLRKLHIATNAVPCASSRDCTLLSSTDRSQLSSHCTVSIVGVECTKEPVE